MRTLANLIRTTPHVCPSASAMPRQNPCPNCVFIHRVGSRLQIPFELLYRRASLTQYVHTDPDHSDSTETHPTIKQAALTPAPNDLTTALTTLLLRESPAGALLHDPLTTPLLHAIWSSPNVPD